MANIFQNITDWFNGKPQVNNNKFNEAFLKLLGGQAASYDYDNKVYLDKGFGMNPDVYSIINQKAKKISSIPFYLKEVVDQVAREKLSKLELATKGNYTTQQLCRKKLLETKAFKNVDFQFPIAEPNPLQTWEEIFYLLEVYLDTIGNAYLYMVWPEDGNNSGVPKQVYVLPAQLMKIVLKKDANTIEDDDPIDYYMIIEGDQGIEFKADNVIHFKYPNPFFDFSGSHLYGLAPTKVGLRNIESSNDILDGNVKTAKNRGVYGFIGAKDPNTPFTADQGIQMKDRIREMYADKSPMSNISGVSAAIEFTKLSLDTDKLQPFAFSNFDQKTLCNIYGWSVMLLNSTDNMTYDNLKNEKKRVLIDSINPNLKMFAAGFNKKFIPRFKDLKNAELYFDITEAPEMQEDYKEMLDWMNLAPLTPNEIRTALKYETIEEEGMDVIWIPQGKKRIDDADIMLSDINKSYDEI